MKILLLTSPAPAKRQYGFSLKEKRFPLGLGYIVAALREWDDRLDITVKDLYTRQEPVNFLPYEYIGIYTNTICFKRGTLPLLAEIEKARFQGRVILGGPHAIVMPETIPDYVDHIVQGEGELVLPEILSGQNTNRIIKADRIENLDRLPRVAYDIYNISDYRLTFEEYKKCRKVFTYSSSRGCVYNCSFCSAKNIYGRRWTYHSAERVVADMQYLVNAYGVDGIYFREDNFTVNKNRLREICNLLIKYKVNIKWKCETRVDLSLEEIQLMKAAGCVVVYVGFESGSQELLIKMNKQIDLRQAITFVGNCKKTGILVYGSFVVGYPFETPRDAILTKKFVGKLKLDRVCMNKYLALPGSETYDALRKNPKFLSKHNTIFLSKDTL